MYDIEASSVLAKKSDITARPAPLNSTQTQAAAAAALEAYRGVVPDDLAGLATATNVTNAQTAIVGKINANEGKIDALQTAATAIRTKTDAITFTGGNVNAIAQVVSDKTGYALTAAERSAIAVTVEQAILNESDGQAILHAIVGAIGNSNVDEIALVAAIRADLERTGGKLDTRATQTSVNTVAADVGDLQGLM